MDNVKRRHTCLHFCRSEGNLYQNGLQDRFAPEDGVRPDFRNVMLSSRERIRLLNILGGFKHFPEGLKKTLVLRP